MTPARDVPPHSLDAERAVLGCVLVRNDVWSEVADVLRPEDFYRDAHQRLYATMQRVAQAGRAIDLLTIREALTTASDLEAVGGSSYIAGLVDGLPRSTNAQHYAAIVAEKSHRRRVIAEAEALCASAWDTDAETADVLARAQDTLVSLTQATTRETVADGTAVLASAMDTIEALAEGHTGIPTGFGVLDRAIGGYHPGQLVIVGARPGVGKSAFVTSALLQWLPRKLHVCIFSLEMTIAEVGMRWLSAAASVDLMRARSRTLRDHDLFRLNDCRAALEPYARYLHVTDTPTLTLQKVRAMARRCQAEHGLDVLVLDYLQLLESDRRSDSRYQEVSAFSRGLKLLAKLLGVPVVCIAQLNRQNEARQNKRPQLSDLRDSGSIEQDADLVLFLHRDEMYAATPDNTGQADLIIAKGRNVPLGTLPLRYVKEFTRFEEWDDHRGAA